VRSAAPGKKPKKSKSIYAQSVWGEISHYYKRKKWGEEYAMDGGTKNRSRVKLSLSEYTSRIRGDPKGGEKNSLKHLSTGRGCQVGSLPLMAIRHLY